MEKITGVKLRWHTFPKEFVWRSERYRVLAVRGSWTGSNKLYFRVRYQHSVKLSEFVAILVRIVDSDEWFLEDE